MKHTPKINWIKTDPGVHRYHADCARYLLAFWVENHRTKTSAWEFAIVTTSCDGESFELRYENGDSFSDWHFDDSEWFAVLDGDMPVKDMP